MNQQRLTLLVGASMIATVLQLTFLICDSFGANIYDSFEVIGIFGNAIRACIKFGGFVGMVFWGILFLQMWEDR